MLVTELLLLKIKPLISSNSMFNQKNTFNRTSKSKILENIKLMQIMLAEMLTLLMASRIMSYIMDLTVDTSVTQRRITIDIKTSIFHAYFAFSVFTV